MTPSAPAHIPLAIDLKLTEKKSSGDGHVYMAFEVTGYSLLLQIVSVSNNTSYTSQLYM